MDPKYAEIQRRQLEYAEKAYGTKSQYTRLKDHYEVWHRALPGETMRFPTEDAVFFISNEGAVGFKVIKFYSNSNDYRVKDGCADLAEAYHVGTRIL